MRKIVFLSCLFISSVSAQEVLDAKLDVLELMIHDNISNARSEYVKLIYDTDKAKAKDLLIEASDRYEIQALKILAYDKYENNAVEEGLSLLCEASILGNMGAIRDLYLLPKLMNLKNKEIEDACKRASSKMEAQTRNIKRTNLLLIDVRNKLHVFEYKRRFLNMRYRSYFNHLLSRFEVFTHESYQEFIAMNKKDNILKLKKLQRENRERREAKAAKGEMKYYLDRKDKREDSSIDVLTQQSNKYMMLISDELKIKLGDFNNLRASNKKLNYQALMEIIKESQ